jgi:hypothetical protein
MGKKRANGDGSVIKRPDGKWEGRISYVDPDTGRTRRQSFYGRTATEVRAKMKTAPTAWRRVPRSRTRSAHSPTG